MPADFSRRLVMMTFGGGNVLTGAGRKAAKACNIALATASRVGVVAILYFPLTASADWPFPSRFSVFIDVGGPCAHSLQVFPNERTNVAQRLYVSPVLVSYMGDVSPPL